MYTRLFACVYVDVVFQIIFGVTFAIQPLQPHLVVELPWGVAAAAAVGIKMIVYTLDPTKEHPLFDPLTSQAALVSLLEWTAHFIQHCREHAA